MSIPNNKEEIEIQAKSKWSSEETKPKKWQWILSGLFLPVSFLLTLLGSTIMQLGNILMFDTHHLEIKVTPKQ